MQGAGNAEENGREETREKLGDGAPGALRNILVFGIQKSLFLALSVFLCVSYSSSLPSSVLSVPLW
jgi:hypothetical protein